MSGVEFADLAGAILLLVGAFLCLSAAVGLVRFPDTLTRMHAATKPQTLGLVVIVVGVAVSLRDVRALGILVLVALLQLMTSPVSAHMVARSAYRSHQISNGAIVHDDLAEDLAASGFELTRHTEEPEPVIEVPDPPEEDSDSREGAAEDSGAAGPGVGPPARHAADVAGDGPRIEVPDHDPGEEPEPPR